MAMADRRSLLARLAEALSHPDVDGVLGTPDVVEELLLLGALEDKVVIGSMNRGGLDGATWTMDDRFTGYDAATIAECGLEGGKMLLRIDDSDDGTAETLEGCAKAVSELADAWAGGDGRAAAVPPRGGRVAAPAQGCRLAVPRHGDRERARHDERLHVVEDAVLRRARTRSSRRRPCRAWCSAGCRTPTRRRTWRPGAARSPSRPCAAWSWAGRCSTRPTARCSPRSTRPPACCARRGSSP